MVSQRATCFSRRRLSLASPLLLAAALLLVSSVHAEPSADDRRNANALVLEGRRLFKSGDYIGALSKFQGAHEILRDPTTGLNVAMALEALNLLVEARAMVDDVSHLPAQPNEPFALKQARAEAAAAIEALESRIPALVLRIEGAPKDTVTATVDGKKIPANSLTTPLSCNPGPRRIVVSAQGFRTAQTTIELTEGIQEPVEVPILLERAEDAPTPPRNKVLAYAGIAVSGTLAGVALGTGIAAARAEEKGNDDWQADNCTEIPLQRCYRRFDEQESKRVQLGSTALWTAVGAAVVGGGTLAYVLLTRTSEYQPSKQAVMVSPTLGGVVVWGVF